MTLPCTRSAPPLPDPVSSTLFLRNVHLVCEMVAYCASAAPPPSPAVQSCSSVSHRWLPCGQVREQVGAEGLYTAQCILHGSCAACVQATATGGCTTRRERAVCERSHGRAPKHSKSSASVGGVGDEHHATGLHGAARSNVERAARACGVSKVVAEGGVVNVERAAGRQVQGATLEGTVAVKRACRDGAVGLRIAAGARVKSRVCEVQGASRDITTCQQSRASRFKRTLMSPPERPAHLLHPQHRCRSACCPAPPRKRRRLQPPRRQSGRCCVPPSS